MTFMQHFNIFILPLDGDTLNNYFVLIQFSTIPTFYFAKIVRNSRKLAKMTKTPASVMFQKLLILIS